MAVNFDLFRFENLKVDFSGSTVLLDVDGTLTSDSSDKMSDSILKKVDELKKNNTVYLCTNSPRKTRNRAIEEKLGLKIINLLHKKPSGKIFHEIEESKRKNIIVIGDKYLTDGLFARNIEARFIKVERLILGDEAFYIKIFNVFDDLVYRVVGFK